ncbi:AAA family ATPase [Streptococcus pacificus]|uniref:AAA family ATPase n=1 Tax=Streptococcus pacificus TaxID=2740577 RepID=UPI001FE4AB6D|nr:AAA family ATPase [Streptococcus pacificus]
MEEEYFLSSSKKYHSKSHGEAFLTLIQGSFNKKGLYIIDEPKVGISPQRMLTLMFEIKKSILNGTQFIIATHSPILLGFPNVTIFNFDESGINTISYEETSAYEITKLFIENKETILNELFKEN